MSPDRLQEVARELLKPAIEAIIREENEQEGLVPFSCSRF